MGAVGQSADSTQERMCADQEGRLDLVEVLFVDGLVNGRLWLLC